MGFSSVLPPKKCPGTGAPSGADISGEGLISLGDVLCLPDPKPTYQQLCGGTGGALGGQHKGRCGALLG